MSNTPPLADKVESPRGATWMHEDLAAYIEEQTGYQADVTTIRLAFALRADYRKSEQYLAAKAAAKAEKEALVAERKAAREQAKAERAAAKAQREAEKAAQAEAEASAEG